jgi:hypothetical protein
VKAGRVTTSFLVSGEPPFAKREDGTLLVKNRSLFGALARVHEGVPVARLIIDDYDTLKLAHDDVFIPALSTWLISATRRQPPMRDAVSAAKTIEAALAETLPSSRPIMATARDDIVNRVFTLRCDPAYIDNYISTFRARFRRVFVRGGRAAAIMRDLGAPVAVVEMLNADAPLAAAAAFGMGTAAAPVTVGDMIRRVVGKRLGALRAAVLVLERVARADACLRAKGVAARGSIDVDELRRSIKDDDDDSFEQHLEDCAGLSPAAATALEALAEQASKVEAECGQLLRRMRDNIREGHCQCCMLPFGDPEMPLAVFVMVSCCQILICERCAYPSAAFIRRCPNCARDACPAASMRVGAELDLRAALQNSELLATEVEPEESAPVAALAAAPVAALAAAPAAPIEEPYADASKLTALVQLAAAGPIECIKDVLVAPYVAGLLVGNEERPWPEGRPRKIMVFAMVAEIYAKLRSELKKRGIRYCTLQGSRAQRDEAVRALREEDDMRFMLVSSPKDCGGLHLPFLDVIVFYHVCLDQNIASQVAGRGQRTGRDSSLEIITLVNETEAENL